MGATWLWSIMLKKVVGRVVQLLMAWAGAHQMQKYGVDLDAEKLTVGAFAALEAARNAAKVKLGWKWLW